MFGKKVEEQVFLQFVAGTEIEGGKYVSQWSTFRAVQGDSAPRVEHREREDRVLRGDSCTVGIEWARAHRDLFRRVDPTIFVLKYDEGKIEAGTMLYSHWPDLAELSVWGKIPPQQKPRWAPSRATVGHEYAKARPGLFIQAADLEEALFLSAEFEVNSAIRRKRDKVLYEQEKNLQTYRKYW